MQSLCISCENRIECSILELPLHESKQGMMLWAKPNNESVYVLFCNNNQALTEYSKCKTCPLSPIFPINCGIWMVLGAVKHRGIDSVMVTGEEILNIFRCTKYKAKT